MNQLENESQFVWFEVHTSISSKASLTDRSMSSTTNFEPLNSSSTIL